MLMTEKADDLAAVRTVVETLRPFEAGDQERIIRWAREKLGLSPQGQHSPGGEQSLLTGGTVQQGTSTAPKDIRTFIGEKNPTNDNQFAATVAYYYRFVAPESARKESTTADDLQEACRLTGRTRLSRPAQTLINAHKSGFLDKGANRGDYAVSTVGENLVAVSLPSSTSGTSGSAPGARRKRARVDSQKKPNTRRRNVTSKTKAKPRT
jgi:hypothetical protein